MTTKNKKTRLTNKINKTEQSNFQKLKEVGGNINERLSKFTKKNAPKVKSNIKKTFTNVSKSVKKNAPTLKKQALKITKGALKKGKGVVKGTVTSVKGGLAGLASVGAEKAINQVMDRGFKRFANKGRDKNMSLKDWRAKRNKTVKEANKNRGLNRVKQLPGLIKKGFENRGKLNVNRLNYGSDENKRIRDKESIIKSDKSTRQEKSVAKVQKSALIRKRDNIKLSDVRAKQEKTMRDAARKRHKQFKKTGKSTVEERRAAAKKRMQDAARARNKKFQSNRKKRSEEKKNKKDKYTGISTI